MEVLDEKKLMKREEPADERVEGEVVEERELKRRRVYIVGSNERGVQAIKADVNVSEMSSRKRAVVKDQRVIFRLTFVARTERKVGLCTVLRALRRASIAVSSSQ
jgi:hypothetical protein